MADDNTNKLYLDGQEVTAQQLQEAQNNPAKRIVEDKDNPGHYRTLTRMQG